MQYAIIHPCNSIRISHIIGSLKCTFPTYRETCMRHSEDGTTKRHIVLRLGRPVIIRYYNRGMGGTDLFNQRLAYYRTSVKSRRWPHRIIFHFLLACAINAYILHKEHHKLKYSDPCGNLLSFSEHIWEWMGSRQERPVAAAVAVGEGTELVQHEVCRERSTSVAQKPIDLTKPHFAYSIQTDPTTVRRCYNTCKVVGCTARANTYCLGCKVPLCIDLVDGTSCFTSPVPSPIATAAAIDPS